MTRESAETLVTRWWPVIVGMVAWLATGLGAYYSVQADLAQSHARILAVEQAITRQDEERREDRQELLAEIHELRSDVKRLLERSR